MEDYSWYETNKMMGLLATFAIAASGTALGLIIAHFSSNERREIGVTKEKSAERQRELISSFESPERE